MRLFKTGNRQSVSAVLMFVGVMASLVLAAVTIAAVSDSETISYFSGSKQKSARAGDIRRVENDAVRNGSEQWRNHAVMVAAVEAPYLRPPVVWGETQTWRTSIYKDLPLLNIATPTWGAEYKVLKQDFQESMVVLTIKNTPRFTFTLKKPFGNWWYISEITDMTRSGAGPETLKGVQLIELRPTALKHSMKLTYDPESKLTEVSGVGVRVALQAGYNLVKINGNEYNCPACPMLIKGKLFVSEDVMSRIIAESLVSDR